MKTPFVRFFVIPIVVLLLIRFVVGLTPIGKSLDHEIYRAAVKSDLFKLKLCYLLGGNPNVGAVNVDATALGAAVNYERYDSVFLLLKLGADPLYCSPGEYHYFSGLFEVISKGKPKLTQLMIDHCDLNKVNKNGWSAMAVAFNHTRGDLVKKILDAGADPNQKLFRTHIPAVASATEWRYGNLYKDFLDRGARINEKNDEGVTVLMMAAEWGEPEVIADLLARGADVHAVDSNGRTTLDRLRAGLNANSSLDLKQKIILDFLEKKKEVGR